MEIKKPEKLLAKATKRERTNIKIKTLAVFPYFNGLSLRAAALEYLGYNVSHEAVMFKAIFATWMKRKLRKNKGFIDYG